MTMLKGFGRRGSALLMIAMLMMGSAVVRLGAEAGPALSRVAASADKAPAQNGSAPTAGQATDVSPLLLAMRQREERIAAQEAQITDRLHALRIAEETVEKRLADLVAAEERLRETLAVADGATERDVAQLTNVYEQMKSKEAAAVFEEMDPNFAAGFLARMRPEVAASVLEGMDPKAAYAISVILAGRSFRVPTE